MIRSIVFVILFIGIQLITIPFQKITLPKEYGLSFLLHPELGNVVLFSAIAFFLLARQKLFNIKEQKSSYLEHILWAVLFLTGLSVYFSAKYYLSTHADFAVKYILIFLPLQYLLLILFTIFLLLAVFGLNSIKLIIKDFKKEIVIVSLTALITYIAIELLKDIWPHFSAIVTYSVYFLLKLSNLDTIMNLNTGIGKGPMLGAGDFIVNIGKPCSGIDSLTLFTLLYLFIFFTDHKIINKKKMLLMFIPGAIGMFLVNILRVYTIMLIGAFYSKDIAIGLAHSNAGWIFFIIYSFIFWWFAYGLVKN